MEPQATVTMKTDSLGRVERVPWPGVGEGEGCFVRRVASGGRLPGSALVARELLARERRALLELTGMDGVPHLVESPPFPVPRHPRRQLQRSFLEGVPLHAASSLPRDYFEHLEQLVRDLHARGVCHNDLHKEGNILVAPDGRPCLIDFQLASLHPKRGRRFEVRASEDLRHVAKHYRRYVAATGNGVEDPVAHLPHRRSRTAALWMRCGKPIYNLVTRRLLHTRDGEPRRSSNGPWPRWDPPLGQRATDFELVELVPEEVSPMGK